MITDFVNLLLALAVLLIPLAIQWFLLTRLQHKRRDRSAHPAHGPGAQHMVDQSERP